MKTSNVVSMVISIIAVALAAVLYFGFHYGDTPQNKCVTKAYVDSVTTENVQNMVNPIFSSVDEVMGFRTVALEAESIDQEFNLMADEVLKNVAAVCIKREGHVSKRAIIYEYRANRAVYDNLPTPKEIEQLAKTNDTTAQGQSTTAPGSTEGNHATTVNKPADQIEYNQHDTTIGGKQYKVHKRTEVTYDEKH
jgi:hypothetical protein